MRPNTYAKQEATSWPIPNYWDALGILLVLAVLFSLGWGADAMVAHYHVGQKLSVSLSPSALPYYALRSTLRMLLALVFSLVFTFIFGTWAAKSRYAERLIIPAVDILQSVPILGFLTIAVFLIPLFSGSLLGPELVSIFVIFTAQVWNIILSFYQSLKTVPHELREASDMFQLSAWQRFWRVEVPFAMPGLIWNMMMSMSSSWVFLTASEAITVAKQDITLPGIGSYIALAIDHANKAAVCYVIIAMFVVIALYDQLLFRPLVAWSEKFKAESTESDIEPSSWVLDIFQQAPLCQYLGNGLSRLGDLIVNCRWFRQRSVHLSPRPFRPMRRLIAIIWNVALVLLLLLSLIFSGHYIFSNLPWQEGLHVLYLGLMTGLRVMILIVVSSIIWVPIGVWVGLSPRASQLVQPVAQFFAAFPANLLFPLAVILILKYQLNVNIWTAPLMILGTQWYILFNVVAGASALPKNLKQSVAVLNVRGWLWWKRFILPGIFPYYITGAITAAGGAWNLSIIAEAPSWGATHLHAVGLGDYIDRVIAAGDFPRETLGIVVMALYVLLANYLLWRPLYRLAEEKFQIR